MESHWDLNTVRC